MKQIDFHFSPSTAASGMPWQLKIDGVDYKATQVIFEQISGHTLNLKNEKGHVHGWVSLTGVVSWVGTVATVRGVNG